MQAFSTLISLALVLISTISALSISVSPSTTTVGATVVVTVATTAGDPLGLTTVALLISACGGTYSTTTTVGANNIILPSYLSGLATFTVSATGATTGTATITITSPYNPCYGNPCTPNNCWNPCASPCGNRRSSGCRRWEEGNPTEINATEEQASVLDAAVEV